MPRFQDLTGQRFGRLLVLREGPILIYGQHRKRSWICRCDCSGNEIGPIAAGSLKNGSTQSCGCIKKEADRLRAKDYTGETFENFLVLRRAPEDFSRYECKCVCGNVFTVHVSNINAQKTCGCEIGCTTTALDIAGQKFGRLTAIERVSPRGEGSVIWLFRCDCGNSKELQASRVSQGVVRSCGCLHREFLERQNQRRFELHSTKVLGNRFGRLTVISFLRKQGDGKVAKNIFYCHCDCGKDVEATGDSLLSGRKKSCGCLPKGTETFTEYVKSPEIAERDSVLYFVEFRNSFHKIGIATDMKKRSNGDYTQSFYERWMPRANARGVELLALRWTSDSFPYNLPDDIAAWGGSTELRHPLDIDETVDMLDTLADECEELGWRDFWQKYALNSSE